MAMPQRDNAIEEIKRLDALLEYAVEHNDTAEAEPVRDTPRESLVSGNVMPRRFQRHKRCPAMF